MKRSPVGIGIRNLPSSRISRVISLFPIVSVISTSPSTGKGDLFEFYSDGKRKSKIECNHNQPNGKTISWNTDGIKEIEGYFKNGKAHGEYKIFDKKGNLSKIVIYKMGKVFDIKFIKKTIKD